MFPIVSFIQRNTSNLVDNPLEFIWRILLLSFPYFLIFNLKISNGVIILLSITAFINAIKEKRWKIDIKSLFWCSSLFLISLLATFYSIDPKQGMLDVESRLPLILFPITFSLKYPSDLELKLILKHFYLSLGVTFLVCLGFAFYRNFLDPWEGVWFNQWYYHYVDFTEPIDIHPLYLSLYVVFAASLLIIDLVGIKSLFNLRLRIKLVTLLALLIFLVMLGSRWTLTILIFDSLAILILARRQISKYWFAGFIGLTSFLFVLVMLSPVTRERFIGTFSNKYTFSNYGLDRLVIWSVALNYVGKNPSEFVIGHGTGSSKQLMDRLYVERDINWDFKQKNSTHNQYLDFLLNMGFIGLFWLLFFLFASLRKFLMYKDWVGISFIILIVLALIAENYLNRQKGIAFFGFTYCLLFLKKLK